MLLLLQLNHGFNRASYHDNSIDDSIGNNIDTIRDRSRIIINPFFSGQSLIINQKKTNLVAWGVYNSGAVIFAGGAVCLLNLLLVQM